MAVYMIYVPLEWDRKQNDGIDNHRELVVISLIS